MKAHLAPLLLVIVIIAYYSGGCRSTSPQAENQEFDITSDDSQTFDEETDEAEESGTAFALSSNGKLPHPKEASAWFTRQLLMTTSQPSASQISDCVDLIDANTKDATNLRSMEEASINLRGEVSKKNALFHWCFYQMMSDLDNKLDKEASLMNEKADLFLVRMSKLAVLAMSLDDTIGTDRYMSYLRKRYTEISQSTFGRHLEVMDRNSLRFSNQGRGKSSAPYEDN